MKSYLPLVVAAVLLFGGCGKKEEPRPVASQPSLIIPGDSLPPSAPPPPLPDPNVPKGPVVPMPQAGQAGDHSSPAFKGGGKTDLKK